MKTGASTRVTLREARAIEEAAGVPIDRIEVTTHGDRERMVLITVPRCAYCGRLSPEARCWSCGASVLRDGAV